MDWVGTARSNYFAVKDRDAFNQAMQALDARIVEHDSTAKVALISTSDGGDWPDMDDEGEDIDFPDLVASHLCDGEVAVFMCIGHEGNRYLTGVAIAVNARGEQVLVSMGDIYECAAQAFGVAKSDISLAEY